MEALHALYSRTNFEIEEFQPLVHLMYEPEYLNLMQKLYEWSVVGPDDIDDTRYTISKKLSEVRSSKEHQFSPCANELIRWCHTWLDSLRKRASH